MYSSDCKIAGASITNAKEVTAEDILREGDVMWGKVKKLKINITDAKAVEELMGRMRLEHKEFCTSYPLVMRYMAQFYQYHHSALKKYLAHIKVSPWKSEEEWLESQATYAMMLYRELNPRYNRTHAEAIKRNVASMLKQETEDFKKHLNDAEKIINEQDKRLKGESRQELMEYFKRLSGGESVAEETPKVE